MPTHTLHRKQTIRATRESAWDFFSNARNLAKSTPPGLGFQIVTPGLPARIHAGLMIEYRVTPLLGIPLAWLTEITHVSPGEYFVDEQRRGPYALWHHAHWFHDLGGGRIELEDRVTYRLPFQPIGDIVHPLLVKPQLEQIFAFRAKVMAGFFPD